MLAGPIDVAKPKSAHEHLIVDRSSGQRFSLSLCEGRNSVVEMRHQYMALLILHPG